MAESLLEKFPFEPFPLERFPLKPLEIPKPNLSLPMTTIVAGKCSEGVVIACDSQATQETEGMKSIVNKIVPITDGSHQPALILAGSGDADHITLLSEAITNSAKDRRFRDKDLRGEMEHVLLELFKKHNVEKSKAIELDGVHMFFKPEAVLGVRFREPEKDGQSFGLYYLRPDGFCIPVKRFRTLGSGAKLADFLLGMGERQIEYFGLDYGTMDNEVLELLLMLITNQVKHGDLFTSGPTRIAVVDKSGARELSTSDMLTLQQKAFKKAEKNQAGLQAVFLRVFKGMLGGEI